MDYSKLDQYGYPLDWPKCKCGLPVLDGHLTCGRVECGTQKESSERKEQES